MTEHLSTFVLPENPTPKQMEMIAWASNLWARLPRSLQTEQKWKDVVECTRFLLAGLEEHEDGVLALHKPRAEKMVDEEATIEDPVADDVLVDVQVCDYCFHLLYPEGPDDHYDPDVFWPCPTARAAGVIPQKSSEGEL